MRFYCGISKRISLKLLLKIILGFLAFFGIYLGFGNIGVVLADSTCNHFPPVDSNNDPLLVALKIGDDTSQSWRDDYNGNDSPNSFTLNATSTNSRSSIFGARGGVFEFQPQSSSTQYYLSFIVASPVLGSLNDYDGSVFYKICDSGNCATDIQNMTIGSSNRLTMLNNYTHLTSSNSTTGLKILNITLPQTNYPIAIYYPLAALYNPNSPGSGISGYSNASQSVDYINVIISDYQITETELTNNSVPTCSNYTSGSILDDSTQAIVDSISVVSQTTQAIIDSINDSTVPQLNNTFFGELQYYGFNGLQSLLSFPIDMINTILANKDTCTPYSIDLSSITRRWGNFNYTLTLPCIRGKLQTMLGNWYVVFDSLIAGILFYYFAMNLILKINDLASGVDSMPYFFASSSGRTTQPSRHETFSQVNHERGH